MAETIAIRPQPGKQEQFLSSPADIVFYGGAAGGGKTFALLLEPLRHIKTTAGFGAVYFRRTSKQHTAEGGTWDEAGSIYPHLGASGRSGYLDYTFPPYGNRITFAHMEHEDDRLNWLSSQIPLIIFDQLETFMRIMFFYMLSRNRSTCGVKSYIRCAYNPVPPDDPIGGWIVRDFISWYLDENQEYPDPDKAGVVRWFVNVSDKLHWYDSRKEARAAWPDIEPKSFTFIPASIYDNKILLEKDPGYLANLQALDYVEEERLHFANHKIKPAAGIVFNRSWFEIVDALPAGIRRPVRFWDLAASERKARKNKNAATAGVKMTRCEIGQDSDGRPLYVYYVLDCREEQFNPAGTDDLLKNTASQDGLDTAQLWEEEGGASGKRDSTYIARMLSGYDARGVRPQGDKLTRSRALAAQAYAGNVKLLRGPWNDAWLNHMHAIPDGGRWDIHDASAGAFNALNNITETGMRQGKVAGRAASGSGRAPATAVRRNV